MPALAACGALFRRPGPIAFHPDAGGQVTLGGSISGAGPTSFWLAGDDVTARRVMDAVRASYAALGIACSARTTRIATTGALGLPEDATTA